LSFPLRLGLDQTVYSIAILMKAMCCADPPQLAEAQALLDTTLRDRPALLSLPSFGVLMGGYAAYASLTERFTE